MVITKYAEQNKKTAKETAPIYLYILNQLKKYSIWAKSGPSVYYHSIQIIVWEHAFLDFPFQIRIKILY